MSEPEPPALPKKDFRKAYLNAGFYEDENGTRFTENSHTLADGSGDTYGPHNPKVPAVVRALREATAKGGAPEGEEPVVPSGSSSSIS